MKLLIYIVIACGMVLGIAWKTYHFVNATALDRSIARYKWRVEELGMESGTWHPQIRVKLSRFQKDRKITTILHVPSPHPEFWKYETLKLNDEIRFKAYKNVLWSRVNDLPGESDREGIAPQRFLSLAEFPWRTAKAESDREELEKNSHYRHLIDIVNGIKTADRRGDEMELRCQLWDYAITLRQWRGEALVTEPKYLLPAKFWNKQLHYRGNEISLDDGVQRQPSGKVYFRVEQKKGKPQLLAIQLSGS